MLPAARIRTARGPCALARDARTPWYAKLIAALAVAYAFSPIQLIPSGIPVLGMFDDVVVLSLGMRLALRLIPKDVLTSCREHAIGLEQGEGDAGATSRSAIVVVGTIWAVMATLSLIVSVALLARVL
jgi:uncharacterized membrane protein YkvA (DUF1232 family)